LVFTIRKRSSFPVILANSIIRSRFSQTKGSPYAITQTVYPPVFLNMCNNSFIHCNTGRVNLSCAVSFLISSTRHSAQLLLQSPVTLIVKNLYPGSIPKHSRYELLHRINDPAISCLFSSCCAGIFLELNSFSRNQGFLLRLVSVMEVWVSN
jgi:hypothetical protein